MMRPFRLQLLLPIVIIAVVLFGAYALADGGGDIIFRPAGMDPVLFSHDYHIKTRGIRCNACHFKGFAKEANGYQMQKEKLNKRDFCGHCHNGMKGFDATSNSNCSRCHRK
jgi:c(7)-type cytochrome triheme protein